MAVKTLVVDNFHGSMTPYQDGDINSGLAYVLDVSGYDPIIRPGNLKWYESATQIDSAGSVITDMIVAGKPRLESGISYVYAIGHTGRLYKIQVNDPTIYNPNYDNPVLLATITSGTPTFTRGGFIDFFGTTEKIYIGHDKGVTSINFDGTGEAVVGVVGSWTQTVPRPFSQFLGNLYAGNGTNIAEIIQGGTVATYGKLSPAFATGTQVRDIDITPDGNYIQIVVANAALADITATATNTSIILPADSFIFSWNGIDVGYTSSIKYPATTLSANLTFGQNNFVFGYDTRGGGVYNPVRKFLTSSTLSVFGESPLPNAIFSESNMAWWATILPYDGFLSMLLATYGTPSEFDQQPGYWAPYFHKATAPETDIIRVPCAFMVSNFARGASSNSYTSNIFGESKLYFSTLETSAAPTTKYRFWKWSLAPSGLGNAVTGGAGIYQTQNQVFSKKVLPKEIRVYGEPWVANNAFTIDLIGSAGTPITGGSKSFVAGTNLTIGDDFAWYTPATSPTYAIGLRITNDGTANNLITKVEIDHDDGGK